MGKVRQPQRIPPPLKHGDGAIDAEIVLRENEGDLAIAFWKTVRTVQLWAELPAGERAHAFEKSAVESRTGLLDQLSERDLVENLSKAAGLLQPRARAATVARACGDIAEWCVLHDRIHTAIEFSQAAAAAVPDDAEFAWDVARLCREVGALDRAETWYREAISRSRRAEDWSAFARAYVGLGTVYGLKGTYPQANRALLRGLRAARRFSFRPIVAAAAHELVIVAIRAGRAQEVVRHGRTALDAYGSSVEGVVAIGHDIGVFLLEQGYFALAKPILGAIPDDHGTPGERLARFAALVHLAGIEKDRATYEGALAEADALVGSASEPVELQAQLGIARGALRMGATDRARAALDLARPIAEEREDARAGQIIEEIETRLESASSDAPAESRSAPGPLAGFARRLEKRITRVVSLSEND